MRTILAGGCMSRAAITGRPGAEYLFWFLCPGCKVAHAFETPRWTWNGNEDHPTFSPSLLLDSHMDHATGRSTPRCHLFLNGGLLQFLSDSTHGLAGQTVPLPLLPEWLT